MGGYRSYPPLHCFYSGAVPLLLLTVQRAQLWGMLRAFPIEFWYVGIWTLGLVSYFRVLRVLLQPFDASRAILGLYYGNLVKVLYPAPIESPRGT